jgi:ribosomal protein S18 acetylase RimI-like enzyme
MRVRLATAVDIPALARVHVASWQAAYRGIMPDQFLDGLSVARSETAWREMLALASQTNLVCELDQEVVGFAACGPTRDFDQDPAITAELYAIYFVPAHWSKGYGHALWQRVRDELIESGYQKVTLWVLEANARARRFYEREGFTLDLVTVKEFQLEGTKLLEVRYWRQLKTGV